MGKLKKKKHVLGKRWPDVMARDGDFLSQANKTVTAAACPQVLSHGRPALILCPSVLRASLKRPSTCTVLAKHCCHQPVFLFEMISPPGCGGGDLCL